MSKKFSPNGKLLIESLDGEEKLCKKPTSVRLIEPFVKEYVYYRNLTWVVLSRSGSLLTLTRGEKIVRVDASLTKHANKPTRTVRDEETALEAARKELIAKVSSMTMRQIEECLTITKSDDSGE